MLTSPANSLMSEESIQRKLSEARRLQALLAASKSAAPSGGAPGKKLGVQAALQAEREAEDARVARLAASVAAAPSTALGRVVLGLLAAGLLATIAVGVTKHREPTSESRNEPQPGPGTRSTGAVSPYEIQTGDYSAMATKGCDTAWAKLGSMGGAGKFDEGQFKRTCERRLESVLNACASHAGRASDVLSCANRQLDDVVQAALMSSVP